MKNYIAVVAHDAGNITKYLDFEKRSDAEAHVAEHGGFVASSPGDDATHWRVDVTAETITVDAAAVLNELQSKTVLSIKAEAGRRIIALVGNDIKQRNALALASVLLEKRIEGTFTAVDSANMAQLRNAQADVVSIRTRSNTLEDALPGLTEAELAAFDPTLDEHWI